MLDIKWIKNENPKPIPGPENPLVFGTIFTDHMFVMDYTEGLQLWYFTMDRRCSRA